MFDNVLLLQGPVGPFFQRVSADLRLQGHRVTKVNFNAGDRLFSDHSDRIDYCGTPREWPDWLDRLLEERDIQRVYLFGDSRFYHRLAKKVAKRRGIDVYVFECGYIRPDFVTLEAHGVNGNSEVPKDPGFYRSFKATPQRREHELNHDFSKAAVWAIIYYLAAFLGQRKFPHYLHHRNFNPFVEGLKWTLSIGQKLRSVLRKKTLEKQLYQGQAAPYFFVPLQVHNDAQVRRHSSFRNIEAFVAETINSFAIHAPKHTKLVLKHHPMDRPYRHYGQLIRSLSEESGVQDRVVYLHDLHLPTLLHHALGTVTINSTVGLSSIHHRTPVKTLGAAVYDIPGLTHQGSLDDFWSNPGRVDHHLYTHFRAYLLRNNQLRGSLYQPLTDSIQPSGLSWPSALQRIHLEGHRTQTPLTMIKRREAPYISAA